LSKSKSFTGLGYLITWKEMEKIMEKQKIFMTEICRHLPTIQPKFKQIMDECKKNQDEGKLTFSMMRNTVEFMRETLVMKMNLNDLQEWDIEDMKKEPKKFAEILDLTNPFFDPY
jgi:hypothetical protein